MPSRSARHWRIAIALGVVVGAVVAAAMVWVARLHDAADAARAPGHVEWAGLALLAAGWFVAAAAAATLVARVVLGLAGGRRGAEQRPAG